MNLNSPAWDDTDVSSTSDIEDALGGFDLCCNYNEWHFGVYVK